MGFKTMLITVAMATIFLSSCKEDEPSLSEDSFKLICLTGTYNYGHGKYSDKCNGRRLQINTKPSDRDFSFNIDYYNIIYVEFDNRPSTHRDAKSILVDGILEEQGFFGSGARLKHAKIISETMMSEEEIKMRDKTAAINIRRGDAFAECLSSANRMSLTNSFDCGFFPEPVYSDEKDKLLLSVQCSHKNAFGQEVKMWLRFVNVNGVTIVTSID